MADYIYSNPWREAAGFGDSLASGIAHLAVQLPQLRMQQQQIAAHTALLNAQREYEQQRTSTLLPQEVALQKARTGTELAQGGYYKAHERLLGAQTEHENTLTGKLTTEDQADHEIGTLLGNIFMAQRSGQTDKLNALAQRYNEVLPLTSKDVQKKLPGIEAWLGGLGNNQELAQAIATGQHLPFTPNQMNRVVPGESSYVGPTGNVLLPQQAWKLNPGQSVNFNQIPVPQMVESPQIPTPFGPSVPSFQDTALLPRSPIVSQVQQQQSGQASPYGLLTRAMELGYIPKEQRQALVEGAMKLVPQGTNTPPNAVAPPPPTGVPKVGDRRIVSGKNYQWNGKKWEVVK